MIDLAEPTLVRDYISGDFDVSEHIGQSHIDAVREKFPGAIKECKWISREQIQIDVVSDKVPEVVQYLYYDRGGWLATSVGNDERPICGRYAIYYVLSMEEGERCMILVRETVDPITCHFPSVSPLVPAVVWGEREIQDLFGLKADGIIDDRPLVKPDDWPDNLYPLRKDTMDYRYRPEPTTDLNTYEFLKDTGDTPTTVTPMGPLHIANDEPAHFRLFTDGEQIVDADYRFFFVHRGIEKAAETRFNYDSATFLAERICGLCGYTHSTAFCDGVETAQEIEVPLRAQYIRSICCEVERLQSHMLNIGLICHFAGFDNGFQHVFREREKALDLAAMLTGARKTYGMNLVGGVRRDILKEQTLKTFDLIKSLREGMKECKDEIMSTPNFIKRVSGVGKLDKKVARDYSAVGPVIRGDGFARDNRWTHPYLAYKAIADDFKPITYDTCDVLARTEVRIDEVLSSIDIIERLLSDELPDGPILTEGWKYRPVRSAASWTEAPRGENCHWTMLGDNQKIYRWRVRTATYNNWPTLRWMFRGNTISDAPLIVSSIDPCYSCCDRMSIVDIKKRTEQIVTMDDLKIHALYPELSPLKF
ncbi:MAG: hydrogenase large subunit [Eggerthellaceae bacterium]|nr:hydrogenase large subunit [Eggerthellaceae bacterium]